MNNKKSEHFLSRWSQRKITRSEQHNELVENKQETVEDTKINEQDQQDESQVPLWLQDNVDADSKKQALSALFKQAEFNHVDNLNDYDEDFTQFTPLGDVVTHEMKRVLRLAEEKIESSVDEKIIDGNDKLVQTKSDDEINDNEQT